MKNGFTLIEMMVVLSIFTIMPGVVLANLPNFRERTALQLVAQKLSLTIREAQVYGVGVKASSATVLPSHGIHFYPTAGGSSNQKSYILFADNDFDGKYTSADKIVTPYDLTGTVEIQSICTYESTECISRDAGLDIVFVRPNTEAKFVDSGGGVVSASYANITLVSTRSNETRTVQVWNTGQISVKPI